MRVGIDGASWLSGRGYGRFTRNAVRRLVEVDRETTYIVYIDEQSWSRSDLPARAEHRTVAVDEVPTAAAAADSRRSLADILRMTLAVRRDSLDAFLFPSVYTYFPVLRVPTVVGVHDTIGEDFPGLTLATRRARVYWWAKRSLAMRRAARLFTVSEASRAALSGRFGLPPERLAVVPEAADPVFSPRVGEQLARSLAPLGLEPGSFFAYAGGISPHKNLETLIEAYAELRRTRDNAPPLVLAGDFDSDPYLSSAASVRDQVERLGLQKHVLLPGFVSDEALACLYGGATAVVLPSLAEGFGLPAVEAAACGATLVVSDLPAHRETLDDSALFVQPTDVAAISRALASVLDDPGLRRSLGQRARTAAGRLSWDAAAERLRILLVETVEARRGMGG